MRALILSLLASSAFAITQLPPAKSLLEKNKDSTHASITINTIAPLPTATPKTFGELESSLDKAMSGLQGNVEEVDLYFAAKARLQEAHSILKLDPKSDEREQWLKTCTLLTEAALTQIATTQLRRQIAQLHVDRAKALNDINAVNEEIIKVEQGNASALRSDFSAMRSDLEEQKRKLRERQEDAEKRFNELNSALIQVRKDARGTIISMSDILFDVGKASLTADLKTNLAKISGILTIYKDANVIVEGHTDNQGSEEYNHKLSEKRASNVMDFMVTQGIDVKRLSSAGFGFTKPVAENTTKEGRQKNRRVDLVIQEKKTP